MLLWSVTWLISGQSRVIKHLSPGPCSAITSSAAASIHMYMDYNGLRMWKGIAKKEIIIFILEMAFIFRTYPGQHNRYAGYIHPLTPLGLICWMDGALIKHSSYRDRASLSEIPVRMASTKIHLNWFFI